MLEHSSHQWPSNFDFETDETCQQVFKPFIEEQMSALVELDQARPQDITYVFHQHAERVANSVKQTCLHMGLGEVVANNMYWAALPHDIGKARLPVELWDTEDKPDEGLKKFRRTHTLLGAQMVHEILHDVEHPFKDLMAEIMANHHEQMDGQGTHNLAGEKLSAPVRLVAIVEAFDGWSIPRPHFGDRDISPAGVLKRMREEKLHMFDEALFAGFEAMMLEKTE